MSNEKMNDKDLLERAVAAMARQAVAPDELAAAAGRVRQRLGEGGGAEEAAADHGGALRGCADVRALFPRYRAGTLAAARELLVQDHLRECALCRAAFADRGVAKLLPWRSEVRPQRGRSPFPRFALAAAVLLVGGGVVVFRGAFRTAPAGSRAELVSADGPVYVVSGKGQRKLAVGGSVDEREWVRTPQGSRAVLRLRDDSRVELREHTELGVSMNRRDVTVHLERGSVIVRAAKRHEGHLFVATEDASVAVTGTVFSVSRGLKGSRVSVLEGSVRVEDRKGEHVLQAGTQLSTSTLIASVPIREEIAWSREVDQHLGVLKEITALDEKLQTVRWPGLRYGSQLLDRLPAGVLVVAAIPNYGDALQQAQGLFQERLAGSEVLRRFWTDHAGDGGQAKLDQAIEKIGLFSQFLGEEIVLALAPAPDGHGATPIFLAEVKRPGLRALLETELGRLGNAADRVHLYDQAALADAPAERAPSVLLTDTLVGFALEPAQLRALIAPRSPSAPGFTSTPFGQRLADAYRDGAGLLVAVDLESITAKAHLGEDPQARTKMLRELGAADVKYLVIERQNLGETVQNRATLSFGGPRQGLASWLAAPAPMGALDFVSGGASFAAAVVVKEPALVLDDILRLADSSHGDLRGMVARLEGRTGVQLREDLAAPLGNDFAFAIDGPLLPVPSWKLVMEVYDPDLVSQTIERLVGEVNRTAEAQGQKGLVFERKPSRMPLNAGVVTSQQTFVLRATGTPFQACFLFYDGYLVAAPGEELLYKAVQSKQRGQNLRGSWRFRDLLPPDRQANFSGLVYHNLGEAGATVASWVDGNGLPPEQKSALEALARGAKPGLVYVYGEPDKIQVASAGGIFGLSLEHVVGSASIGDLLHRRAKAGQ